MCIVRLTSLGDVVHTLPVAHALRCASHATYIVWLAEEAAGVLLARNPSVDQFIPVPIRRWQSELRNPLNAARVAREFAALVARTRALDLEALIDVQGLLKSAIFTLAIRPPKRIGFAWRHAREPLSSLFLTDRVAPPPEAWHVVDKNLSLLQPLGIAVREPAFPLPGFATERARIDGWLRGQRVGETDTLVAILPATRRKTKQWPTARYLQLAERLRRRAHARFVVPVGPGEEELGRAFAHAVAEAYVPLPATSVPELVELFRRVSLVVGNDTGPLHIAAAVGAPCVGLFGPTSGRRNGPYGERCQTVESPTGNMEDISVDEVFEVAVSRLTR